MKKSLKLTITGLVQGVGLRTHIQEQASKIGKLEGTAQNMPDGSIVVLVCGEAENVDALVDQVYKGTPKAKIELVLTEALVNTKELRGVFRIIG